MTWVNIVKKNTINDSKQKGFKKIKNKRIEILAKSKYQYLLKFNFKNLFRYCKSYTANTIRETDF